MFILVQFITVKKTRKNLSTDQEENEQIMKG